MPQIASRLHAILVDAMEERVLYLTWDDESQELEDHIRAARQRLDAVRRLIYRLERDAEAHRAHRADRALAALEP